MIAFISVNVSAVPGKITQNNNSNFSIVGPYHAIFETANDSRRISVKDRDA